jgi:protein-L-isoaspartate(D-aspartate) O-methyltransferase
MSRGRQEEYVAKEFDRAAKGYDESRIVKSFQRRAQILVIDKMHLEKGMKILDLGCGTGWGTIDIATKLGGTGEVVGLDLSEKMIEQAKQKLNELAYNNVEFEVGSGSSLDYRDYFDYVFSTNAFHHFAKKEEIFYKVYKSLKYGGIFMVQDICDDYLLMRLLDFAGKIGERAHVGSSTSDKIRDLFTSAGFVNIGIEKIKVNWFWGIMIGKGDKRSAERK